MYTVCNLSIPSKLTIITSPFFYKRHPLHFLWLVMVCFQILHVCVPKLHLHTWQDSDNFTKALTFKNDHMIYYHMDVT